MKEDNIRAHEVSSIYARGMINEEKYHFLFEILPFCGLDYIIKFKGVLKNMSFKIWSVKMVCTLLDSRTKILIVKWTLCILSEVKSILLCEMSISWTICTCLTAGG